MTGGPRHADYESDILAFALLALAGALLAAAGVVWLAGHVTLLLTGHGWVDASFADSPTLMVEMAGGDGVRSAWSLAYPSAPALAPAALFWALTAAIAALLSLLVGGALVAWRGRAFVSRGAPARWASHRKERRLTAPKDPGKRPWRIVAGSSRATGRLLAGDDCVSAVVFGPNGSGKTTSLIVPNVLDWDGPVVMTTAKPQDLEPVCTARATSGPVWVIAPGGAPGHECAGWSPVRSAIDEEAADRIAEWLVESSGMTGDPRSRPWNAQARKYLKGLLLAAHLADASLRQWCDWLYAGERARDQVEDILRRHGHHGSALAYASTYQIHEEGKGSVLFTAMGLADTYSRPGVMAAAERADVDVDRLLDESGTLCIVTPSGQGDRFAPYFTALVTSVIHAAETRAAHTSSPLTPRLLLALDEAGNVFRYPRLPHLLTTSRGNGIQLLLIYHDLAQVEHLYGGREVARTVLSNAKMRLLLPGVGDLETLRYWSDLLGRTRTQTRGETYSDGHRSRSRSEQVENLAPLHTLQQLPNGQAVLVYENLPPTRVRLLPWFRNSRYRDLWTIAPPVRSEA
jgi:type IV secretion system protein VirD4